MNDDVSGMMREMSQSPHLVARTMTTTDCCNYSAL